MIYTITLNPAVDLILHIKNLQPGEIHRTNREYTFPEEKGSMSAECFKDTIQNLPLWDS